MEERIWSLGYEGHTPESLVALLRLHRIQHVVDVRHLPLSRRPGFSKTPLRATLEAAGIAYTNLRPLGAPKDLRAGKAAWTTAEFRQHYEGHLAGQVHGLMQLAHLATESPTAMLCVETDPEACHRIVLHERLRADGFDVVDLR